MTYTMFLEGLLHDIVFINCEAVLGKEHACVNI